MCFAIDQRSRFDLKVAQLRAAQGKNVRMFTDSDYLEYINKVKEIRTPGHRMVPTDFYLMKRFEVMQVEKIGALIEKLVKPGTTLRYATFESLCDIIKEVHEEGLKWL